MKKITAVVPVRKGSVRVKNKNIKPFANSSLLEIKIKQLQSVPDLDKIVVSSDCEEMIDLAWSLGVEIHERQEYYASSAATNSEFFKNLAQELVESDCIMYSPVTCPLISRETYVECIRMFQSKGVTSLATAAPVKHHMWLDGSPLNYTLENSPNSQDLPDIYKITYGICILDRADMIKHSNVVVPGVTFKVVDEIEAVDIDTEFDFLVAEHIYKKLYLGD